jgi:menaquinone-dependent protoporphyrinogen oxidase
MIAGGALGAGVLLCSGATFLGSQAPAVDFVRSSCGKEETMKKVLVTYASKYGATGEVAQAIADQFCGRGAVADVRRVDELAGADAVSGYDAVVVGSAVRMGRWLPPAVEFVERNAAALQQTPTAFFTVHMLATDDSEASREQRASYVAPAHAVLTPQHEAFFAGEIDTAKLGLGDRLMVKLVRARTGDYRDWKGIRSWADSLFIDVD